MFAFVKDRVNGRGAGAHDDVPTAECRLPIGGLPDRMSASEGGGREGGHGKQAVHTSTKIGRSREKSPRDAGTRALLVDHLPIILRYSRKSISMS